MLEVILQGGLGNQMFEYATARSLAEDYGCTLSLDMSLFNVYKDREWCRPYSLEIFKLHETSKFTNHHSMMVRVLPKVSLYCRCHGIKRIGRYHFEIDRTEGLFGISESAILFGYFTNVHFLNKHTNVIRKEFEFISSINSTNQQLIDDMTSSDSVSIHIRRGDYLYSINQCFANIGEDWYRHAIKIMEKKIENPRWFFFSDDPEWVRMTFQDVKNAVIVDVNIGKDSYNDMMLMTHCKHNIIANSTFSWWGAWLNRNPDKIVIAPRNYYTNQSNNVEKYLSKMIPEDWIVLD